MISNCGVLMYTNRKSLPTEVQTAMYRLYSCCSHYLGLKYKRQKRMVNIRKFRLLVSLERIFAKSNKRDNLAPSAAPRDLIQILDHKDLIS